MKIPGGKLLAKCRANGRKTRAADRPWRRFRHSHCELLESRELLAIGLSRLSDDTIANPDLLTVVGDALFFRANNSAGSPNIYVSDAQRQIAQPIYQSFSSGTSSPFPSGLVNVNGSLFFIDEGDGILDLNVSDAPFIDTRSVDVVGQVFANRPIEIFPVGPLAFFLVPDGSDGNRLSASDGTTVASLGPALDIAHPIGRLPSAAVFARGSIDGDQLWRTDGTPAGTALVQQFQTVRDFVTVDDRVYFAADVGRIGTELWSIDRNSASATNLSDIRSAGSSNPQNLTNVNGTLFFTADNGINGRELWTAIGDTVSLVADLNTTGDTVFDPNTFTPLGNRLLFGANNGAANEMQLWSSDGTSAGTRLIRDVDGNPIANPLADVRSGQLPQVGDEAIFVRDRSPQRDEWWITDGVTARRAPQDVIAPAGIGGPRMVAADNRLYVVADDGQTGTAVWELTFTGSILGTIFIDETGNGFTADDTRPRRGVTVELFQDNGDGTFNGQTDARLSVDISDDDGTYQFTGLDFGRYFVRPVETPDFTNITGRPPATSFFTVDVTGERGEIDIDFVGDELIPTNISGTVRNDRNGNGQTGDDPALGGWQVRLLNANGQTVAQTQSADDTGAYQFNVFLDPGNYTIAVTPPEPLWEPTLPRRRFDDPTGRGYATGAVAGFVTAGDIDRDGDTDLVVVNDQPGSISVLVNRGDGSFVEPAREILLGTRSRPQSVELVDLDRDGDQDIVVAALGVPRSGEGNAILALRNDGTGQFEGPRLFSAGRGPVHVDTGDINGDQIPDLAVGNFTSQDVSLLLGQPDGTFAAAGPAIAMDGAVPAVRLGDLDGDGDLDLVAAIFDTGNIRVLRNDNGGTFQSIATLSEPAGPLDVLLHDWDGDGRLDLGVADHADDRIWIYFGEGSGGFASPISLASDTAPQSLSAGDFNGDQIPDLAVANADSSQVTIYFNQGRRGFSSGVRYQPPATNTGAGVSPQAIVAGDWNGDGTIDLAVAHYVGGIGVLFNRLQDISIAVPPGSSNDHINRNFGFQFVGPATTNRQAGPANVSAGGQGVLGTSIPLPTSGPFHPPVRHNSAQPRDVNDDGIISALDALLVINHLNDAAARRHAGPIDGAIQTGRAVAETMVPADLPFVDVNADQVVSAIDVLLIINELNRRALSPASAPDPPPIPLKINPTAANFAAAAPANRSVGPAPLSPHEVDSALAASSFASIDQFTAWRRRRTLR